MKKILLSMTKRQHSVLKGMAKEKEISLSEFIRRLFDETIDSKTRVQFNPGIFQGIVKSIKPKAKSVRR